MPQTSKGMNHPAYSIRPKRLTAFLFFDSVDFSFARLIAYRATRFACRLATCLAFAATRARAAFHRFFGYDFYVFHFGCSSELYLTVKLYKKRRIKASVFALFAFIF